MSSGAAAIGKTGGLAKRIAARTLKIGAVSTATAGGAYAGFGAYEWNKGRHRKCNCVGNCSCGRR